MSSLIEVRDALTELLIYLDRTDEEQEAVLPRFQDLRHRLGDECTMIPAYLYSVLQREKIWEKLGNLWEALSKYAENMREETNGRSQ